MQRSAQSLDMAGKMLENFALRYKDSNEIGVGTGNNQGRLLLRPLTGAMPISC
jgi:hypothetical protein